MAGVVQGAAELQQLFERFTALSATALRAVDAKDGAALEAALDARSLLDARMALLSRMLGDARRTASTKATRDALDVLMRPVRAAGAEAERLNGELVRRAQAARLEIGGQLDRLRHDDAARTAYALAAGGAGRQHLDRTR